MNNAYLLAYFVMGMFFFFFSEGEKEEEKKEFLFYDDSCKEPVLSHRAATVPARDSESPDRRVQFNIGEIPSSSFYYCFL